jgi:hypothetical protein
MQNGCMVSACVGMWRSGIGVERKVDGQTGVLNMTRSTTPLKYIQFIHKISMKEFSLSNTSHRPSNNSNVPVFGCDGEQKLMSRHEHRI